jgi:hypothetical protein
VAEENKLPDQSQRIEMTDLKATGYLTNYSLDRFVSQELSKLTECNAAEVASRFPQSSHWIGNFVLNSMFGRPVSDEARKFCLAFLRRAEAAFFSYELARQALVQFAGSASDEHGPTKSSIYFRALHFYEVSLAMQWQGLNLFARLSKTQAFKKGDGSSTEKLNQIYNASKHYDPASLPADQLHAVWITNEGLNIKGVRLTFAELDELMVELGKTADYASSISFHGKGAKAQD